MTRLDEKHAIVARAGRGCSLVALAGLIVHAIFFDRDLLFEHRVVVFRDAFTFFFTMDHAPRLLSAWSWPPLWGPFAGLVQVHWLLDSPKVPDRPGLMRLHTAAGPLVQAACKSSRICRRVSSCWPRCKPTAWWFWRTRSIPVGKPPLTASRCQSFASTTSRVGCIFGAGSHRVAFTYAPWTHRIGGGISIATGFVMAFMILLFRQSPNGDKLRPPS